MIGSRESSASSDSPNFFLGHLGHKKEIKAKVLFELPIQPYKTYLQEYFEKSTESWWNPEFDHYRYSIPQSTAPSLIYRKQRSLYTHRIYRFAAQLFQVLKPKHDISNEV